MVFVHSLKNFLKGLGYYFTPLGVCVLTLVTSFALTVPGMIDTARNTFDAIAAKLGSASYDWGAAQSFLFGQLFAQDWSQASSFLSFDWLLGILKQTVVAIFGTQAIVPEVLELLQTGLWGIAFLLVINVVAGVLSVFVGFIWLKVAMRKRVTDANMVRVILVSILDGLIFVGFLILVFFIYDKTKTAAIVTAIIAGLLLVFGSVFEAYLFYGVKKVKLRQVFSPKALVQLFLADIIIAGLAVGLSLLLYSQTNIVVAFSVAIPFVEVCLCVISINAEGMVADFVKKGKLEKKAESAQEKERNQAAS